MFLFAVLLHGREREHIIELMKGNNLKKGRLRDFFIATIPWKK
jgi:hypothetical protein